MIALTDQGAKKVRELLARVWRRSKARPRGDLCRGDLVRAGLLHYPRALAWTVLCCWRARRALHRGGLRAVSLPPAPAAGRGSQRGLRDGLRWAKPSCLERSLVRRAWHQRQGRDVPIVIGVRGSGASFGAHAWLQGDPPDPGQFVELLTWLG